MTAFTLNTSIVIAAIAGNIVPSVAIIGTQSVNTVFVFLLGCALLSDVSSLLNSWTQQTPKERIQSLLNSSIH